MLTALLFSLSALASPEPVSPEDVFSLDAVRDFSVSGDGQTTAYVLQRWIGEQETPQRSLWTLDSGSGQATPLLTDEGALRHPVFSVDGDWIYFINQAPDRTSQVFRMKSSGGTPQQLTHLPKGAADFQLLSSRQALYVSTNLSDTPEDQWAGLRGAHTTVTYADRKTKVTEIYEVSLSSLRAKRVAAPEAYIMEFSVSPRERRLAMLTSPSEQLITQEGGSEVQVLDLASGDQVAMDDTLWRDDAPSPRGWLLGLAWSSDENALAFRIDYDGYPGETFISQFSGDSVETRTVPRPGLVHWTGSTLQWVPGKRELCQRGTASARTRIYCINGLFSSKAPKERAFPSGDVVVHNFEYSADGRDIIVQASTPDRFPELYLLRARGRYFPYQLTQLNPQTENWSLPEVEVVSWTSPDGTTVEGILETPAGWDASKGPLPLLVHLHGGPTAHTPFSRRFRGYGQTLFSSNGWAVLSPNYRGSTGYGDEFLVQLVGQEQEIEVADILSGVDAMVERGIANEDKMAVMGWSNGGYLTNALISQTTRFKAASSGAGVVDQTIQWALEDTPGHVINFMEGLPWDQPSAYGDGSPLRNMNKATTPTLIHVGELDPRVPAAHAKTLFRALDFYLGVDSELILYPGMYHGLRKRSHILTKLSWDQAWFRHYVLEAGKSEATPPAADTSPSE